MIPEIKYKSHIVKYSPRYKNNPGLVDTGVYRGVRGHRQKDKKKKKKQHKMSTMGWK